MKKLLLLSAIVLGSASIASAQASEPVAGANKTATAPVTSKKQLKIQAEAANAATVAGARPSLSTTPAKPVATKKTSIRKVKAPAAAKTN